MLVRYVGRNFELGRFLTFVIQSSVDAVPHVLHRLGKLLEFLHFVILRSPRVTKTDSDPVQGNIA